MLRNQIHDKEDHRRRTQKETDIDISEFAIDLASEYYLSEL